MRNEPYELQSGQSEANLDHKVQPSNQPIAKCRRLDAMSQYDVGNRVRIDIPDETDPDHEQYHGKHGRIADILEDEAGSLTGDEQDSLIYQIQLDNGDNIDVLYRAIRPPIE